MRYHRYNPVPTIPMYLPKHTRNHPLQFLVYLEWILLLIAALGERQTLFYHLPRLLWLNWMGIGLLALSGFWIPKHLSHRIVYTVAIIALILFLSFVGNVRFFQLLFTVLVVRSCFIFKPRVCLVITGIVLVSCVLVQAYRFQFFTFSPALSNPVLVKRIWLGSVFLAGLTLVFLQWLVFAVLSERQSREQLMIAHAKLRQYALEIENLATVQERNRIAREIHDSLGHSLTVFNLHLEAALRLLETDPEEARSLLLEAKQLSSTALQEVRQSVTALRADPLHGRSLKDAITALIDDFQRSTQITPQFHYQVDGSLSAKLEVASYRIVQEALTNICKYATASEVSLSIVADQTLRIAIQDNGTGFDATQTTTGFGLQGMQERTFALAGQFTLTTAPQAGCRIDVVFPIDASV